MADKEIKKLSSLKRYLPVAINIGLLAGILAMMVEFQIVKRSAYWEPAGITSYFVANAYLGAACPKVPSRGISVQKTAPNYPETSLGLAVIIKNSCKNGYISESLLARTNFWVSLCSTLIMCILLRITCQSWAVAIFGGLFLTWTSLYGEHSAWHIGGYHLRLFLFIVVLFLSFYLFLTASFLLSIILSFVLSVAVLFFGEFNLIALTILTGLVFLLYNPWSELNAKTRRLIYQQLEHLKEDHLTSISLLQKMSDFGLHIMVRFRLISLFNPLPEPFSLWIRRNRLRHWFIINALIPILFYAIGMFYIFIQHDDFWDLTTSIMMIRSLGHSWRELVPILGKIFIHVGLLMVMYSYVKPRMKVLIRIFLIFMVVAFTPLLLGLSGNEHFHGAEDIFDGVLTIGLLLIVGSIWQFIQQLTFFKNRVLI